MGKTRTTFECTACGVPSGQWAGRCPSCGGWGTIEAAMPPSSGTGSVAPPPVSLLATGSDPERRLRVGMEGVDRVLGGGLVPGSVVLVAGEPGIGKSTLLLQIADRLTGAGHGVLLASGEESHGQVAARARRLGLRSDLAFVPGRELPHVFEAAGAERPAVLMVDSIQAIRDPDHTSLPGGPTQVRLCADRLVGLAKAEGIVVILAGQVTKDGEVAGPRTLEHAVDVVCSFDGDQRTGLRVLAGGKNRFGPEGELAWFEMGAEGLVEADPSELLTSRQAEPGAAVGLLSAGRRAVAVEVQALVAPTEGSPRRHVTGLDPRRFGLVAAVVDRATGLRLGRTELYGATAGGLRIEDPGCDLAVAAALASAATGVPPPGGRGFIGEVSLTGAVRGAPNPAPRLAAAAAAGLTEVYAPPGVRSSDVRVRAVRHLYDALTWAAEGGGRGAA
ncbi:MAG TPA: AAA family ATPase [Actinomycetota bacterium]